jgi:hypothetical protein
MFQSKIKIKRKFKMIASEKFIKEFVEKHNIDCLIGSDEINAEKFFEWFDEVKEKSSYGTKIKEFDINSAIRLFDDDLYEFYEKYEEK